MLTLQQRCVVFLVHFGVNVWLLNDNLMSAYDLAAARKQVGLARFIDAAASQAFESDNSATMRICRRAADDASRRLAVRQQSSSSQPPSTDLHDHYGLSSTSQIMGGWRNTTLPDDTTSSLAHSSSVFIQSPRLANGRLFPTDSSPASRDDASSIERRKRQLFLTPRSGRRSVAEGSECSFQPSRPYSTAARQLLMATVGSDDSLFYDVRERLRNWSLNADRCDDVVTPNYGVRPCCSSTVSQLSRIGDDMTGVHGTSSEVSCPRTVSHVKHGKRSRRHRQRDSDTAAATDRTSKNDESHVYSVPADCVGLRQKHQDRHHANRCRSHLVSRSSSKHDGDERLRSWLADNGLTEYWPALTVERVDMDTLTLLDDKDLRELGIPLGPRRRLQHVLTQRQSQPQQRAAATTPDCASISENTRL